MVNIEGAEIPAPLFLFPNIHLLKKSTLRVLQRCLSTLRMYLFFLWSILRILQRMLTDIVIM